VGGVLSTKLCELNTKNTVAHDIHDVEQTHRDSRNALKKQWANAW